MSGRAILLPSAFLFFVTGDAFATRVIAINGTRTLIAVSQDPDRNWQPNERACAGKKVPNGNACGEVIRTYATRAFVRFEEALHPQIIPGDEVWRHSGRGPASEIQLNRRLAPGGFLNLTVGVGTGLYYALPMAHLQVGVGPKLALGAMPFFFSAKTMSLEVAGIGALGTLSYSFAERFKGLFVSAGFGLSQLNVKGSGSRAGLIMALSAGSRIRYSNHISLGISLGLKYLDDSRVRTTNLNTLAIQPLLLFDVGFNL